MITMDGLPLMCWTGLVLLKFGCWSGTSPFAARLCLLFADASASREEWVDCVADGYYILKTPCPSLLMI